MGTTMSSMDRVDFDANPKKSSSVIVERPHAECIEHLLGWILLCVIATGCLISYGVLRLLDLHDSAMETTTGATMTLTEARSYMGQLNTALQPLVTEAHQKISSSSMVISNAENTIDVIYNIVKQINATAVGAWSTGVTPDDLKQRWDLSLEVLQQLVKEFDTLMHAKLSLSSLQ